MLIQFGGERRLDPVAKGPVQSLAVAILDPGRDFDAGMSKAEEQRLVQQRVAPPAVIALAEAVLHSFAWRDVMPLHADLAAPCQQSIACEFAFPFDWLRT